MSKLLDYIRNSVGLQSIIVWAVIFLFLFIQPLWANVGFAIATASITFVSMLAVYYFTQIVLIPRLLLREKKVEYVICSILTIVPIVVFCIHTEFSLFRHFDVIPKHEMRLAFIGSRFFTLFLLTYAVSNIIFFFQKAAEDAKQKEELLSEKKMLEVRVLKSQINSHFLFNALNNIYSMIYFKDEYTSGYVLKLAQMMRYVMEDCETELTPLSKEIEYIENFIDFQKIRFENMKDISFSYNKEDNANISVPPMIFQPLVENCFKHAPLDVDKNSYIHISLEIDEKSIRFISENSQPLIKNKPASKETGIGIENVKRRLSIYYNNNYSLQISDDSDCYKVELSIHL